MLTYQYFPNIVAHQLTDAQRQTVQCCRQRLREQFDKRESGDAYGSSDGFVNVPYDQAMVESVKQCARQKRDQNIGTLVIIGIGGSSLGARALCQLVAPQIRVVFLDTLDCLPQIDWARALVNVVSKTGTTLETVAWLEVVWPLLQKAHGACAAHYMIVTTDAGSPLQTWARGVGAACLQVPALIGGRWSVLTPVGLFACALLYGDAGVDELLAGARYAVDQFFQDNFLSHDAVLSACMLEQQCRAGMFINDFFLFGTPLQGVGGWHRQLIGESLGKPARSAYQYNVVPTVSVGSCDLHSVAQLYLGGRVPLMTTFMGVRAWSCDINITAQTGLIPALNKGASFADLMRILCQSTRAAYEVQGRPYIFIEWPKADLFCLGQYVQNAMLQTILLAEFFGINPYDQPQVELYKVQARRLLGQE